MRQVIRHLGFETTGRGFTEITGDLADWVRDTDIRNGLLTVHCQHTSASLIITENASSAVLRDMMRWLDAAVPEGPGYEHDSEGPDDMPAHVKSALTGVTLSIPVVDGRMMLGTWQGVFLVEHRRAPHSRVMAVHIIGE